MHYEQNVQGMRRVLHINTEDDDNNTFLNASMSMNGTTILSPSKKAIQKEIQKQIQKNNKNYSSDDSGKYSKRTLFRKM